MTEKHSASGPMAGYLYQVERAVAWLARSSSGSTVGIETGDDVVVLGPGGTTREQDKHSIAQSGVPLGDTSRALWSTLAIWLGALRDGTVNPSLVRFYLVTNKTIPEAALVRRLVSANDDVAVMACVSELRQIGSRMTGTMQPLAQHVLNFTDQEISVCIRHIELVDSSRASSGAALRDQVASDLHLPATFDKIEFHRSLIGWTHETVMGLWRNGQPAWISREAFDQYAQTLRLRLADRKVCERARHLLALPEINPAQHQDRTFVRQIQLVSDPNDDAFIIEAIEDYLGASGERIRLSQEGNITKDDLIAFDNRLHTRWKAISEREKRAQKSGNDVAKETGARIMQETLDHRESLGGHPTEEYYLTRGSYHALADEPRLGWHPDYQKLLGDSEQ